MICHVAVGSPITVPNNTGDTWAMAWTPQGELYSPANDTKGFDWTGKGSNVCFSQIIGETPEAVTGKTLNMMSDYREHGEEGPDGAMWKTSGCLSVDGVLYLLVARHTYGEKSGDKHRRQTAVNASLIKSCNGGRTWVRAAQENQDRPMFPGSRFGAAYFIQYGQDGREAVADGSDRYIYALSNNGFWDNGDDMVLGRVLRTDLPKLDGGDWQFFRGGDGADPGAWSALMADATTMLSGPGQFGSTGAVFLPRHRCYLLIAWHYPLGGGKMPGASSETIWDFHVSSYPWGPWEKIGSHRFSPEGYYCPTVCPKFTSTDGGTLWACTAGDWNNPEVYRLTFVPLTVR